MERRGTFESLGGWIAVAAFTVFSAMAADSALAATSITESKHNLSLAGNAVSQSTTTEVCVFCHTPHGGDTAKSAPLWNRGTNTPASYVLYDGLWGDRPSSFDGSAEPVATRAVGSISLLCLSCHDGATALDLLINAPGSGGYNAAGLSAGYAWKPAMGGNVMPDGITRIGTDLKNDHPIGIPYCGGATTPGTYPTDADQSANCKDRDFKKIAGSVANGFWVDTSVGTTGTREKTDMILYTRAFTGGSGNWPSVECGSCHDPHNADSASATSVAFLRIANTGSQLCLACHVK